MEINSIPQHQYQLSSNDLQPGHLYRTKTSTVLLCCLLDRNHHLVNLDTGTMFPTPSHWQYREVTGYLQETS